MNAPTDRMLEVARALERHYEKTRGGATIREVMSFMGVKSTNAATEMVDRLVKHGLAERRPFKTRSIFPRRQRTAEDERRDFVAWLRAGAAGRWSIGDDVGVAMAAAVERGEHEGASS